MHTESVFAYGTLCEPNIQMMVFDRLVPSVNDVLDGYRLSSIDTKEGRFPLAVPDARGEVSGEVLELSPDELAFADDYETDAYRRSVVRLKSGRRAWVYLENESRA